MIYLWRGGGGGGGGGGVLAVFKVLFMIYLGTVSFVDENIRYLPRAIIVMTSIFIPSDIISQGDIEDKK